MYGDAADMLKGQIFSATISTSPFLDGSINQEIAEEHSKIIELQDGLIEKQFGEVGMTDLAAQAAPGSSLPMAGMISMQDDDDDVLIQLLMKEHNELIMADSDAKEPIRFSIISLNSQATDKSAFKYKHFEAGSLAEAQNTYDDVLHVVGGDAAMLMLVNGRMAKHKGGEDELAAMVGKAIQKGEFKYNGADSNMLVKEENSGKLEKQELALLGHKALTDKNNAAREWYLTDHTTEKELGLEPCA